MGEAPQDTQTIMKNLPKQGPLSECRDEFWKCF